MTVDVAVIVPVLGRPEHAARFVASFNANTPPGRAVVLPVSSGADPVSDQTWSHTKWAWEDQGIEVILAPGHTFASKVNCAYDESTEPWLLLVGSDVIFHPGWLENALLTAALTGAKMVSTNDMHNADVLSGRIATHPLINREWIEEHGSCWDGPGVVSHEGYGHWYQDEEWSRVAHDAGVFAYSERSVVEHLHPVFGGAPNDAVYDLGQSTARADRDLFNARLARYGKEAA